jgi:hypothetical protein
VVDALLILVIFLVGVWLCFLNAETSRIQSGFSTQASAVGVA